MEIPEDIRKFYEIIADDENRTTEDVIVDILRHYRRRIQGVAAKELDELEGNLIDEFFESEGIDIND